EECNQRQPFQNVGRIKSPSGVNRHQSNRGEEMPGVPPDHHSGVHKTAGERPDNNPFFADPAVLKPYRDHAQNDRDQKKWPLSNEVATEVWVWGGLPSGRFFV